MNEYKWNELRRKLDNMIQKDFPQLREGYYGDLWVGDEDLGNCIIHIIREHFEGFCLRYLINKRSD